MKITKNLFKHYFKSLGLIGVILVLFAFTTNDPNYIGTFGVSNDDPSEITLKIEKGGTFSYQDFSNSSKKIKVEGTWIFKNKHIVLTSTESLKFHNKWKDAIEKSCQKVYTYE